LRSILPLLIILAECNVAQPQSPSGQEQASGVAIWSDLAPGETTRNLGDMLPSRDSEQPPITRVQNITAPTMDFFPAKHASGVAVLILPGGGFRYVVPDLEGSEAATWLNELGVTVFVLRYRTSEASDQPWKRPLQDSQRAIRWIRSRAEKFGVDPERVGLFGFSAGGQVASIHLTASEASYESQDEIDLQSFRPNFGLLIYPWRIYDEQTHSLIEPIRVGKETPSTFLVHTHDDASTSLGAVFFYAQLKQQGVPAELHVYQNGGHGYGTRSRPGSMIGSWKDRASEWLKINELTGN
jgi:acetyl esterase/lipase